MNLIAQPLSSSIATAVTRFAMAEGYMGKFVRNLLSGSLVPLLVLVLTCLSFRGALANAGGTIALPGGGYPPSICSDGNGYAYVTAGIIGNPAWMQAKVQSIGTLGEIGYGWPLDGLRVDTTTANGFNQYYPQIIPDNAGGAFLNITNNGTTSSLSVQHIDADGNRLWGPDGILVHPNVANADGYATPDGSGGMIVCWMSSNTPNYDLYAQKIDSNGNLLWQTGGVPVCTAQGNQWYGKPISDGQGGAIIVWNDERNDHFDVYAQRLLGSGAPAWETDGVIINTGTGNHVSTMSTSDGNGGAYVTWYDASSGKPYFHRITSSGVSAPGWPTGGKPSCEDCIGGGSTALCSDGFGGVIVASNDGNNGIHVSRFNEQGQLYPGWPSSGLVVGTGYFYIGAVAAAGGAIIADGTGGGIVCWDDHTYSNGFTNRILMQRFTGSGAVADGWPVEGKVLSVGFNPGSQNRYAATLATDGAGGAFITWRAFGDVPDGVYCARVTAAGQVLFTDDGVWSQLAPAGTPPSARDGHCSLYDPVRERMVTFGGSANLNDVRALALSGSPVWTDVAPVGTAPTGRYKPTAIYDPVRDRMVVFGGAGGNQFYLNDVWTLSFSGNPVWTDLTPPGVAPSVRGWHTAIYDPVRDRMVVFGGYNGSFLNDVWALSLSGSMEWTNLTPSGTPPTGRYGHTAVYDRVRDRMLVFGGSTPGAGWGLVNEVWALSLSGTPAWTNLIPTGTAPSARFAHTAIYDPMRDRMVVFGGYDGALSNDAWALSLSGGPTWTNLAPAGAAPAVRAGHASIYDPPRDRMMVFGGGGVGVAPSPLRNDVWALAWGTPPSPPTSPTNLQATTNGCSIDLAWADNSNDESNFEIQWKIAGQPNADYARLAFLSANVTQFSHQPGDQLQHTYRIRAYHDGLFSSFSNDASRSAASSFEVVSATTDATLYANGASAHFSLITHSNCGTNSKLHIAVDVQPSLGFSGHIGDDIFALTVGEDRVSQFSWDIPGTASAVEYTGIIRLIDDGQPGAPVILTIQLPGWFRSNPIAPTVVEQYQATAASCWSEQVECGVRYLNYIPVAGTISSLALAANDFCKMGQLAEAGKDGEVVGAFWAGQTKLGKQLVVETTNAILEQFGLGAVVWVTRVIHTTGELARNCWGNRAKEILGWIPASQRINSIAFQRAAAGSVVIDSLTSWLMAGIDSTEADVADAFVASGLCSLRVEADSSWTVRDSIGLEFATVEDLQPLGVIGLSTRMLHRIGGNNEANPHSAALFCLESLVDQSVSIAVWHSDENGSRNLLRYADVAATSSTVARLALRDDQSEFPMLVDLDGDGSTDQIFYPGGLVVGAVEPTQPPMQPRLVISSRNPFTSLIRIRYSVPAEGEVRLQVRDVAGRLVKDMAVARAPKPGTYEVTWDGRGIDGARVHSGVYFCHLTTAGGPATQRLVLIR